MTLQDEDILSLSVQNFRMHTACWCRRLMLAMSLTNIESETSQGRLGRETRIVQHDWALPYFSHIRTVKFVPLTTSACLFSLLKRCGFHHAFDAVFGVRVQSRHFGLFCTYQYSLVRANISDVDLSSLSFGLFQRIWALRYFGRFDQMTPDVTWVDRKGLVAFISYLLFQ